MMYTRTIAIACVLIATALLLLPTVSAGSSAVIAPPADQPEKVIFVPGKPVMPGTFAGPQLRTFTLADNGKNVSVNRYQPFKLVLAENPSTGFSWNITPGSGIHLVSHKFLPSNTSIAGAGGNHTWTFQATQLGTHRILGTYRRPWEPLSSSNTVYNLWVRVI